MKLDGSIQVSLSLYSSTWEKSAWYARNAYKMYRVLSSNGPSHVALSFNNKASFHTFEGYHPLIFTKEQEARFLTPHRIKLVQSIKLGLFPVSWDSVREYIMENHDFVVPEPPNMKRRSAAILLWPLLGSTLSGKIFATKDDCLYRNGKILEFLDPTFKYKPTALLKPFLNQINRHFRKT